MKICIFIHIGAFGKAKNGEVLRQRHPQYPFLPLLELLAVNSPDAYEAFLNHVIERVCPHLQHEACDNKYLMRILSRVVPTPQRLPLG